MLIKALESIEEKNYRPMEVVLVNDGEEKQNEKQLKEILRNGDSYYNMNLTLDREDFGPAGVKHRCSELMYRM